MDEQRRLAALRSLDILDQPDDPDFDAIVRDAARAFAVPIALVSLVDEHRQWFRAKVGLEVSETPLASSFCTHAIRAGVEVFEVENATADPLFKNNPLVTGDPNIRFYAGAPLKTSTGARIGTLCVIDRKPRGKLRDDQRQQLIALADRVMALLEERRRRLADADPA